ncbi:MAG: YfiR family protein [Cytophagaceae bacterium]|nr:YfiR family protein [Cytophagaceae bacterium]MDW8456200.1 YfiR family protein [Cytophagaceae bacterium]
MKVEKLKNKLVVFLSLLLVYIPAAIAQVNYKMHSLFIYKFTQYIEWPASASSGDFVIGVVGNSPIISELEALASSKKVGTRNIVVKKLTSSSDPNGCHILFISESQSAHIGTLAGKLTNSPVLILSESEGGAKKGAGINFIIVDDKMKFELNKSAIEKRGLKISADLVKLAIVVG